MLEGIKAFVLFKAIETAAAAAKATLAVGKQKVEEFTIVVRCKGGTVRRNNPGTAVNTAALLSQESIALALATNGALREHLLRTLVEVTNARLNLAEPDETMAKKIATFMPMVKQAAEAVKPQVRQGNTSSDCDVEFEILETAATQAA